MSTLVLVRHAQASFFAADYDRLSPLGEAQARRLGEYWTRRGVRFDAVHAGPRVRQMTTAELVGDSFADAGVPLPEVNIVPELDEHQVDRILLEGLPELCRQHPKVADLNAAYQRATTPEEKHRGFQRLFEAVTLLWCDGRCAVPGVETFREFQERVCTGISRLTEGAGAGRRVVAFSSAGTISIALQLALHCDDRTALELGWRLWNCSLCAFVFTKGRFTLDSFNALPHLDDPTLQTYR